MDQITELLRNVEFSRVSMEMFQWIDTSDPCFLAFLLGIAALLGSKVTAGNPELRSWGLRLGLAASLGSIGYSVFQNGTMDQKEWIAAVVRAFNVGCAVIAPIWLILPMVLFVYARLRLLVASFLAYGVYAWLQAESLSSEDLPTVALYGSMASMLALIVAWILQPVTDFLKKNLLPRWRWPEKEAEDTNPKPTQSLAEVKSATEPVVKAIPVVHANSDHPRRKQRARLKAELCYALHENTIGHAFPRTMFSEFLVRYLGDEQEVEAVEQNAIELEGMILQFVNAQQPTMVQPLNIMELTEWLLEEQNRINDLHLDKQTKKTKLAGVTRKYTQLAQQVLDEEHAGSY